MSEPVVIVGHRNPDNDAICAAVGYAHLKNELARRAVGEGEEPGMAFFPGRLGPLPPESAWVLDAVDSTLTITPWGQVDS